MRRARPAVLAAAALLASAAGGCTADPYTIVTGAIPDGGPADAAVAADAAPVDAGPDLAPDAACVPEVCNGKDDDCNGKIDDVPAAALASNVKHCGRCNNACSFPNAFPRCEKGSCKLGPCAAGFFDADGDPKNGCEYRCQITNGGREACPPTLPTCACDGVDNDCDGKVDEDFDLKSDPNNCGGCGKRCLYSNAVGLCKAGACAMGACTKGFRDLNRKPGDGCEYRCPTWPPVAELCNGKDDDCDGKIDEDIPGVGKACKTGKPGICSAGILRCVGGKPTCIADRTATVELCNGKDDDCDTKIDEDFDLAADPQNCGGCGKRCTFAHAVPACVKRTCAIARCVAGYRDLNGRASDGCEHRCEVFPATAELCNGKDDDCDGKIDEDFDTRSDPLNCGRCGKRCSYPHARASCVAGACRMGACDKDYYDIDRSAATGCEYYCAVTNGGKERCDNLDNDCDGKIDEDFDLKTDANNCGTCGRRCSFTRAAATCAGGVCKMGACTPGYRDLDGVSDNGCEYRCPVYPPLARDLCNGKDDDCDGKVDEDFTPSRCGTDIGECKAGKTACDKGTEVCRGAVGPTVEVCNGKDDDCDRTIDDGFDKLRDPRNCGPACTACSLPHAIPRCAAGTCAIAACLTGYVDLDRKPANGCEYRCTATGIEICDGIDNDCDGLVDAADPSLVKPATSPCLSRGACKGPPAATATCRGARGWVCSYGAGVELRRCLTDKDCGGSACTAGRCEGRVASEETLCDGIDNDCDGAIDETFPALGKACKEPGKTGICQGSGVVVCDATRKATRCKVTTPGGTARDEQCNGLDDDCDGKVDEEADDAAGKGVKDAMVHIKRTVGGKAYDYWIYTYEASRPDGTPASEGRASTRACSAAARLPWTNATFAQASAACRAAGKRLCSLQEWQIACSGTPDTDATCRKAAPVDPPGCLYPYGDTYAPATCNGEENDGDPKTPGDQDVVLPAGSKSLCRSRYGAYDMSGNVREWVDDPRRATAGGPVAGYTVMGGAYDTIAGGLRCDFTFSVMPPTFSYVNLGFRCCSKAPP